MAGLVYFLAGLVYFWAGLVYFLAGLAYLSAGLTTNLLIMVAMGMMMSMMMSTPSMVPTSTLGAMKQIILQKCEIQKIYKRNTSEI